MTQITPEIIEKIANLSMIKLTDEEKAKFPKQIAAILEYVTKLSEINTDEISYQSHVELKNILRDDVVVPSLTQQAATQNRTEQAKQGAFVINAVLPTED
jgi:aspartyl-tRNA(Asn)/glutamyl-tRNA(Gln) amidotransferase subunit C